MMLEHRPVMESMIGRLSEASGGDEMAKRGEDLVRQAQLAMQERLNAHSRDLNELKTRVQRSAPAIDHGQAMEQLTSDRRQALQRVAELEEEIEDLRIMLALSQSLSQERDLKDKITESSEQAKREEEVMQKEFERLRKENFELADRLLVAQRERNEAMEERNHAIERSEQLEQIIGTLRRRIGGGGASSQSSSASLLNSSQDAGLSLPSSLPSSPPDGSMREFTARTRSITATPVRAAIPEENDVLEDSYDSTSLQRLRNVRSLSDGRYLPSGDVPMLVRRQTQGSISSGGSVTAAPGRPYTPRCGDDPEHIYADPLDSVRPRAHTAGVGKRAETADSSPYRQPADVLRHGSASSLSVFDSDAVSPYATLTSKMKPVQAQKTQKGPAVLPYAATKTVSAQLNGGRPESPYAEPDELRHASGQAKPSSVDVGSAEKVPPLYSVPNKGKRTPRRVNTTDLSAKVTPPGYESALASSVHKRLPHSMSASPNSNNRPVTPQSLPGRHAMPKKALSRTQI